MDFIGWFGVSVLTALFIGASAWSAVDTRKRAAGARAWASAHGLTELRQGEEGVPHDLKIKRLRSVPSFRGTLGGRTVSIIATRTSARFGELWVLCTQARHSPIFLGSILAFASVRHFGGAKPKGWAHVQGGADLDPHFYLSVPQGDPAPSFSADARAALIEAGVHAWCFNANPSGFTVLWFKQSSSQDTQEALGQAARLLGRLLA